jgi:uncharacterized phage infection (PIP) family protein YhgE
MFAVNLVSKSIATLASAALLCAGGATMAGAAQAHPAGHRPGHPATSHPGKPAAKLTGPRRAATQAITAQYRSVQRLVHQAATLTGPDAADLQTSLGTDLAAIAADRAAVAGASSVKALNALKAAANGSRQVAGTQLATVQSADQLLAQSSGLTTQIAGLQGQLDALSAGGTDITAAQAALDAISQSITDTTGQLQALVESALALLPTASKTDLHTVAEAVEAALPGLTDALTTGADDLAAFSTTFGL